MFHNKLLFVLNFVDGKLPRTFVDIMKISFSTFSPTSNWKKPKNGYKSVVENCNHDIRYLFNCYLIILTKNPTDLER